MIDLKCGIGVSNSKESFYAGSEAAKSAIDQLGGATAKASIIFAAPSFDQKKMLGGAASVLKKVPNIGGTTAGEVSTKGLSVNSVVVMALSSEDIDFHVGIGKDIHKNEKLAGKQLAQSVLKNASIKDAKSLIMLPDGLAGDGLLIIEGSKKVLGENFEIVGGALGDEANFKHTYQYFNGKVYENCVVGMLICSKANIKTASGVRSGWESVGSKIKCTKSKGNAVYEFDHKRALDVYRGYLGKERAKKLPAIGLEYPIGLIDEKAEIEGLNYFQLRSPLGIDEKTGSVSFAAAIPEGKDVTITYSSRASIINGSKLAAEQAKKTLKGKAKLIMVFSCVARKMVLGRRTNEEIIAIKKIFGNNVPVIGFYTYGEIGPIDKRVPSLRSTRWHNETVVVYALGE